jgi:cytochrome P450
MDGTPVHERARDVIARSLHPGAWDHYDPPLLAVARDKAEAILAALDRAGLVIVKQEGE